MVSFYNEVERKKKLILRRILMFIGYKHPVYVILYLSFLVCIVFPLVYTLGIALFSDDSLVENLLILQSKSNITLLFKSIFMAFTVALLSTVNGTVLGFLLYKTTTPFRNFFKIALLLPLFISPYILAVAWKDFFFLTFNNTSVFPSYLNVILVLIAIYTPLSMFVIGSALATINTHIEETGFLVTNVKNVILKIILPLVKPSLLTSFVLIFIFSISEFSVPAFFGVKVFTTEIFTQFSAFYNHSLAILQSTLLVFICIVLLYADRKHLADAPFISISSKGTSSKEYSVKKRKWVYFLIVFGWFSSTVIIPFLVLLIQSFKDGTSKIVEAYQLLQPTFVGSIGLALVGAILTVLIGFTVAYISEKHNSKSFYWLLLIVFTIPSTVFGISLIKFYNHPFFSVIYSSSAIILIGYVGKFSFISAKLMSNAIKQIPASLDEAAQIEGISLSRRLLKILIPLVMPTLFATLLINFLFCLGELGTTMMLYPPGTEIMPIKVFTIMANAPQSLVSSMTLIVFSITLFLIVSLYFILKPMLKNVTNANN